MAQFCTAYNILTSYPQVAYVTMLDDDTLVPDCRLIGPKGTHARTPIHPHTLGDATHMSTKKQGTSRLPHPRSVVATDGPRVYPQRGTRIT
jgi:hypothetical protein